MRKRRSKAGCRILFSRYQKVLLFAQVPSAFFFGSPILPRVKGNASLCSCLVRSDFRVSRYPRSKRRPSSAAGLAIMMWRAVSIILLENPTKIAVPLESFRPRSSWNVYIISDVGPLALGVAVYQRSDNGSPLLLKGFVSYRLPYAAEGPEFQNAREFQGVLLGIILVIRLGFRHCRIQCRGDNVSALSWIRHDCCKSLSSQTAFIAFSWLLLMSDCEVVEVQHQAGVTMGDIDGLSRFRDTHSVR